MSRRFGKTWALKEVSFEIPSGGALLVLGPSGSGKTTLLRLVAGLVRPDRGSVRVGERLVSSAGTMIPPHRRGMAFVFQRPTLWPHMTALDNVALALVGRGLRRRERRLKAAAALDNLDMARRQRAYPGTLSGGETQRVGLARALVTEPAILLLDEPFAALDAALRTDLIATLTRLKVERGTTVVWVTQRCEGTETLADRLLLLRGGKVEAHGETHNVLNRSKDGFAARFLRDSGLRAATADDPGSISPARSGVLGSEAGTRTDE